MALDGTIRRRDGQPLGSPDHVKTEIDRAFPGTQFTLVHRNDIMRPTGFNLTALLFRLIEPRYPYWEGDFQNDEFAAVFKLSAEPIVKTVGVTLYGRGSTHANAHFARLFEQTGWKVKFW
jgi:hypothetical protein